MPFAAALFVCNIYTAHLRKLLKAQKSCVGKPAFHPRSIKSSSQ